MIVMQRNHLHSRRMEQRFNEKNVKYSVLANVFWKDTDPGYELTWKYDLDYVDAYSVDELFDQLSTSLRMNDSRYEWNVSRLGPFFFVRYKDQNREEVIGHIQISSSIPDKEIIANLVAYGKEHGLRVIEA